MVVGDGAVPNAMPVSLTTCGLLDASGGDGEIARLIRATRIAGGDWIEGDGDVAFAALIEFRSA